MLLNICFTVRVNAPEWDTTQEHTSVVTVRQAPDVLTAVAKAVAQVTGRRTAVRRTSPDTFKATDRDALVATVSFLSADSQEHPSCFA